MIYIYSLSHPLTNEVRYIGKTINLKRRYRQHLYDKRTTHKCNWIQSLKKEGLKPVLTIIETCDENWQDREKYWITQYDNLTNFSDGGGTDYVRVTSDETREKISKANLGKIKSDDHKEKIKMSSKRKQIIIDGIVYNSITEASIFFKTNVENISYKCKSKNFPNYLFI